MPRTRPAPGAEALLLNGVPLRCCFRRASPHLTLPYLTSTTQEHLVKMLAEKDVLLSTAPAPAHAPSAAARSVSPITSRPTDPSRAANPAVSDDESRASYEDQDGGDSGSHFGGSNEGHEGRLRDGERRR